MTENLYGISLTMFEFDDSFNVIEETEFALLDELFSYEEQLRTSLEKCILNSILFRFSIFVDFFRFFTQEVQHSKLKKKFSGRNFCQTIFSKQKISAQRQKNKKVLYSAFRHLSWLTIFEKKIFFYKL